MAKDTKAKDTKERVRQATDEEFESLRQLAVACAADGDLSDADMEKLTSAIELQYSRGRLSDKQRAELSKTIDQGLSNNEKSEVTRPMKVVAGLSLAGGVLTLVTLVVGIFLIQTSGGTKVTAAFQGSTVELVMIIVQAVLFVVGAVLHTLLGIRLLKGKRYRAAHIATALAIIGVLDVFLESMTTGLSVNLLLVVVLTAIRFGFTAYLSPSLTRERRLDSAMDNFDLKARAESDTLGLDLDGAGYIKLDFFNLFWIFVVTCVLGLIVEIAYHMLVVEPGVYQDRRGLLFGPFSPIYGIGAVLMTIALNRFKNANLLVTFVVCTIIGGAFEYAVSWWMEMAYGVIAWDYSNEFLNIGGRTCLVFAMMFGMLGLWWIKWALPLLLKLINKVPWKWRYGVTAVCAVLMLVNVTMTLQALDCWQERVNGEPVVTDVQKFYATYFDNNEMQSRFQSMTITPQKK